MDENRNGGTVLPYPRLPLTAYYGIRYATPEEKRLTKQIVTRFLQEARAGYVYESTGGFGNEGTSYFTIVNYRGKLGIKNFASSSKPIVLNRRNAIRYIKNGAKLVMIDD